MKRNIIVLLGLLLIAGSVSAQHVNVGIKGGLNIYNTNVENDLDYDPRLGFHLGILGHIHLSDRFALQPELVYSMQGTRYVESGANRDVNLDYINVPFLFQFMFDNGFRVQVGPQVGFMASAKIDNFDVKDSYNTVDLGLTAGVSYVNPPTGFGFDARYNHGFTNINDGVGSNTYNRGLQFGIFYLFNHGS